MNTKPIRSSYGVGRHNERAYLSGIDPIVNENATGERKMKIEENNHPTDLLAAILLYPERARVLSADAIAALLAPLASAQTSLAAQLIQATATGIETGQRGTGGRLLTVEEAATKLAVAQDW